MTPKFATQFDWQQAEFLMQPALIRIIDNIRKHLEQSSWRGDYEDVQHWPSHTPPETQARVLALQHELETAPPDRAIAIQHSLDHLPRPYPGYELKLTHGDREVRLDIWNLCYQVCFVDYDAQAPEAIAVIDTSLIDLEERDVDWQRLDAKAQNLVAAAFESLPTAGTI
jgi:hypothetical protein